VTGYAGCSALRACSPAFGLRASLAISPLRPPPGGTSRPLSSGVRPAGQAPCPAPAGSVGVTPMCQGFGFAPVLARSRLRRAAASGLALDTSPFQNQPELLGETPIWPRCFSGWQGQGVVEYRSPAGARICRESPL